MNGDEHHHFTVQWLYSRWPKWVKITSTVVAIAGGLGTVMGFGGSIVNAIHAHETAIQVEAVAKELDKQHDAKVDQTLEEHGKDITATKVGVQEIQNHLAKQDVEILSEKGQLDRIETAIMSNSSAHVSLPTTTPP